MPLDPNLFTNAGLEPRYVETQTNNVLHSSGK
jgi:hypothetical protein